MSTKSGSLSIACVQLGPRKLSVITEALAGCLLFRVCLSIEVQSGLSELSVISWVSAFQGCLLSGVPVYTRPFCEFVKRGGQINVQALCVFSCPHCS